MQRGTGHSRRPSKGASLNGLRLRAREKGTCPDLSRAPARQSPGNPARGGASRSSDSAAPPPTNSATRAASGAPEGPAPRGPRPGDLHSAPQREGLRADPQSRENEDGAAPLRPPGGGGPWAAAGQSEPVSGPLRVDPGGKGLLPDLLLLAERGAREQIRGRSGAEWSPGSAGGPEVRGRPADGGGGPRAAFGAQGSVPAGATPLTFPPKGGRGSREAVCLICPRRPGFGGLWTFPFGKLLRSAGTPSGGAVSPRSSRTL